MNICMIGTGYVGLVTGSCFAALGNRVICIDNIQEKIRSLQNGDIIIYEPGLKEIVIKSMDQGRLLFSDDIAYGIKNASLIFITVDTPASGDGSADLSQVVDAARSIGTYINQDKRVIVKSTVPVGTCVQIATLIEEIQSSRKSNFRCDVAFNPEFLKEGSAVNDFMTPDRIVVGCSVPDTIRLMKELYAPIIGKTGCPLLVMSIESAEITKYAANSMLATRISFINELAKLCELTGADIAEVTQGIGSDPRIGPHFLQAGLGYGGSCFSKDVNALIKTLTDYGLNADLLKAVERINQSQGSYFVAKIKNHFGSTLCGKTLGVWGLTFKPETNDLREAPALRIVKELLAAGAIIKAFDPQIKQGSKKMSEFANPNLLLCNDPCEALEGAAALVVLTEWQCFNNVDFGKIKHLLSEPLVFDGRNIFQPNEMNGIGFKYYSVGRG